MKLFTLIALMLWFACCYGEKTSGSAAMKHSDGWAFLGKFCFQDTSNNGSTTGVATVELSYSGDHKQEWYLVMYDDQDGSWPYVHKNKDSLSCETKISDTYTHYRAKTSFAESSTREFIVDVHEHVRPRWWWAYVANCDVENNSTLASSIGDVSYDIHFYQKGVTMWNKEAGVNDRGLNTMYLFYLCFYVLLFGIQLYAYHVYRVQQYVHQIIKLLTATIGIELFAVLFSFVDWMIFTETGKHELFFQIMSEIGYVLSSTIFLLLLLVLGQGWTISRFEVAYPKLILFGCIISALFQCGFYIWILVGFSDETTKYYYDTLPEWLYGGLFVAVGFVYIGECVYSYVTEALDSKKRLFLALCIFFSVWFLLPLLQILIADAFDPWVRDVAIDTIELTWNTVTFCVMMGLMWPTWAHQYFNLSMGDTQDRILSGGGSGGVLGSKSGKSAYSNLDSNRL